MSYYIRQVETYDEDDLDFNGDAHCFIYVDDALIYEDECNNHTEIYMNGFLSGLDAVGIIYKFDIQKVNECYDCDPGIPGEHLY